MSDKSCHTCRYWVELTIDGDVMPADRGTGHLSPMGECHYPPYAPGLSYIRASGGATCPVYQMIHIQLLPNDFTRCHGDWTIESRSVCWKRDTCARYVAMRTDESKYISQNSRMCTNDRYDYYIPTGAC